MLDEDNSGSVTYKEFVEQLHKLKSQDVHTMLIFIRGFLKDVRMRVIDHFAVTKDSSVRTLELARDMKKVLYGGTLPMESALQVNIEGARGLRTEDSIGDSSPFCVCEIAGKPDTKCQTQMIEDSLDPNWNFSDTITGYAPGDSLVFTVWVRDALGDDYSLGRAVLTTEQIIRSTDGFSGQLELEHDGEHACSLKVRVSSDELSAKAKSARTSDRMSLTGNSLCGIEGKLQQLSQRLEDELAHLIPSASTQENTNQLLQKAISELEQYTNGNLGELRQIAAGKSGDQVGPVQDPSLAPAPCCCSPNTSVIEEDLKQCLERELTELRKDISSKVDEQTAFLRGWKFVAFPPGDLDPRTFARESCCASSRVPGSQNRSLSKSPEGRLLPPPDFPARSRI